jgi:hypothetical protein
MVDDRHLEEIRGNLERSSLGYEKPDNRMYSRDVGALLGTMTEQQAVITEMLNQLGERKEEVTRLQQENQALHTANEYLRGALKEAEEREEKKKPHSKLTLPTK